jgi:hypothetical protein
MSWHSCIQRFINKELNPIKGPELAVDALKKESNSKTSNPVKEK